VCVLAPSLMRRVRSVGAEPMDAVLPTAIALIACVEMIAQQYTPLVVSIGTILFGCAATAVRRGHPILAAGGVLASFVAAPVLGFDVSEPASWVLVLVLASFGVGRYLPRAELPVGLLVVVGLLGGVTATLAFLTEFSPDVIFGVAATFGPWVLGLVVRHAEDTAVVAALEAERARVEDALATERSTRAERDRIAREIHDVLAHSLSLMVVQAAVAESVADRDPAAAKGAAREVQTAGRSALGEVGRLVRLIREEAMLEDIGPFDHIRADLGDSLRSLAEDVTRAGLPVTLDIEPATSLPPALQLTVYRIAQEALTNALKYAAGATATIRVLRQGDQLDVSVTNTAGSASPQGHVNGSGLAGLQERVALFSGTLSYGADSAGGFSLHARLPCESGG
jgi:signal transduction histidine kinase